MASPKVARFAAIHDLAGAEFLAGIPGTVGGALAMNAGCYGRGNLGHRVRACAHGRSRAADLQIRTPDEFAHRLPPRRSVVSAAWHECFVAAWLPLPSAATGDRARQTIKDLLRAASPASRSMQPNAGSVFRNPPGDYAARLIEACGLKGLARSAVPWCRASTPTSSSTGAHATAADIEALIDHVQETVERSGIELEREVRIVGEPVQ